MRHLMFIVDELKLTENVFPNANSRIFRITGFLHFFCLGQFVWHGENLEPEPTKEVSLQKK